MILYICTKIDALFCAVFRYYILLKHRKTLAVCMLCGCTLGKTVIIVTHHMGIAQHCERIHEIADGKLVKYIKKTALTCICQHGFLRELSASDAEYFFV